MAQTTSTRTGRQTGEAAEQTKLTIIKAATSEFAEHGFEGSSLRNIAKRAGTTHGLIRHHFGSKEDVFYAVIDYAIDIFGKMEDIIISQLKPEDFNDADKLTEAHKNIMRNFAKTSAANPEMMRILMHEGSQKTERLEYLFKQIDNLNSMHGVFFESMENLGLLSHWTSDSCFLYILTNLGLVFGLSGVSSHYMGGNVLTKAYIEMHTERIIASLYGGDVFIEASG